MSAIALGFGAVNLFGGFTTYMYNANRDAAIYATYQGHLNITKKGFWEEGQLDPAKYLLTPEDIEAIEAVCKKLPEVVIITPQLKISGLVSNGKISTIFIARAIVPSAMDTFLNRTMWKDIIDMPGNKLEDEKVYGVAVSVGLAKLLDLQLGSYAVTMSTTIDGQMNALDMEVFQLIDAPSEQMNDKLMRVPLGFAQMLYDTKGADRLVVLLDKTKQTNTIRDQMVETFSKRELEFDVKTWVERSEWYRKVKDMFDVIFLFLFLIVFIIVIMSIINTMSMAVLERTREIGTLRALGLKRRGIMLLFALEAALLSVGGTLGGVFLSFIGWLGIYFSEPTWTPPGVAHQIPLRIDIVPEFITVSFLILMLLCVGSSLIPANQAARRNIVDALGHV